jgi:hypothetical protein
MASTATKKPPEKIIKLEKTEEGHPLVVIKNGGKVEHTKESILPWKSYTGESFKNEERIKAPSQPHAKADIGLIASQTKPGEILSKENLASLQKLCGLVEGLVFKNFDGKSSKNVVDNYGESGASYPAKIPTTPNGQCYKYTKVATYLAKYVSAAFEGGAEAKDSVNHWPQQGYVSVGKELPQIAITYGNEVKYSEKELALMHRKEELENLEVQFGKNKDKVASKTKEYERVKSGTKAQINQYDKLSPAKDYEYSKSLINKSSDTDDLKAEKITNLHHEKIKEAIKASDLKEAKKEAEIKKLDEAKGHVNSAQDEVKATQAEIDEATKKVEKAQKEVDQEKANAKSNAEPKPSVIHVQPDITYTLPGDVIVYEQVNNETNANGVITEYGYQQPGHIDIRTYHIFASDFAGKYPLPATTNPGYTSFKTIGVFRKISDTMAMVRVQAFLRIIREYVAGETSIIHKGRSYKVLSYDKTRKEPIEWIKDGDLSVHPFDMKDDLKVRNIPAGAYQLSFNDWINAIMRMGWPRTFDQEMQDRLVIYLLQSTPKTIVNDGTVRRSALGYIMEDKLNEAVNDAKLNAKYSFLPGGKKPELTMSELQDKFEQYIKDETGVKGVIANLSKGLGW